MKTKHNKKRNTAFVYEALLREVTKSIVSRDTERKNKAISILKEYFKQGTNLSKELGCYKALIKEDTLDKYTAEKVIFLASRQHSDLDKKEIFNEQSRLIKQVNTDLGTSTFSNFIPNYKSYATVYQLFNKNTPLNAATGSTYDMCPLLRFHFWEPVFLNTEGNAFPSKNLEESG